MDLPKAPFYRRWSVLLAGVIGLAAVAALVGWRGLQGVDPRPPRPPLPPPRSPPRPRPAAAVVARADQRQARRRPVVRGGQRCEAEQGVPGTRPLADRVGVRPRKLRRAGRWGFKITGGEAFRRVVDIQDDGLKGKGGKSFTQSGYGHLLVESVCRSWKVRVLSG